MTDAPENLPAFPCDLYSQPYQQGMTLRDYFAAAALTGFLASNAHPRSIGSLYDDNPTAAEESYKFADEMLKARNNDK